MNIVCKNYIINVSSNHLPHCFQDLLVENKLYLSSKLMFYTITEKYSLKDVFVYNYVSHHQGMLTAHIPLSLSPAIHPYWWLLLVSHQDGTLCLYWVVLSQSCCIFELKCLCVCSKCFVNFVLRHNVDCTNYNFITKWWKMKHMLNFGAIHFRKSVCIIHNLFLEFCSLKFGVNYYNRSEALPLIILYNS